MRVDKDALELADQLGIKIFTADIIYHLFDNFMTHRKVILIPGIVHSGTVVN